MGVCYETVASFGHNLNEIYFVLTDSVVKLLLKLLSSYKREMTCCDAIPKPMICVI
jgi:hypothetical protein